MNKLDETNELIDYTNEMTCGEIIFNRKSTVTESLLMDIAKSLAIIADRMNKEE